MSSSDKILKWNVAGVVSFFHSFTCAYFYNSSVFNFSKVLCSTCSLNQSTWNQWWSESKYIYANIIAQFISVFCFRNYDSSHLSRAVCGRASGTPVPASFKLNSMCLSPVTPVQQMLEREKIACAQKLSANWNAADDCVEILNPLTAHKAFGWVHLLFVVDRTQYYFFAHELNITLWKLIFLQRVT
jgi:hypothetical protein